MTTLTSITLDPALQALVDARLDTIDRMLLGRVPRADRMGILKEVEAQIEELVAQKDPATLGREDILEVLGQLDPPEGYLPESLPTAGAEIPMSRPAANGAIPAKRAVAATPVQAKPGLLGGIMGLGSLFMSFILGPMIIVVGFLMMPPVLFALPLLGIMGFSLGATGLILGIKNFGQGAWPIVALVTGALGQFFALLTQLPLLAFFF